jgi:hypothetical protein
VHSDLTNFSIAAAGTRATDAYIEIEKENSWNSSDPLVHPPLPSPIIYDVSAGQDIPSAEALSQSGYPLVRSSKQEEILDEVSFLSGEIPWTSFERSMGNAIVLNRT